MRFARLRACAQAGTAALTLLALFAFGSGQALAHPTPPAPLYTAIDLGTLGGTGSSGFDLDRHTVVGAADLPSGIETHAFAYDRATHVMTDLGTLGGRTSSALAVQGPYVIGDSTIAEGGFSSAFVYDLRTHVMTGLGTFGGTSSSVTGISGHFVTGSARTTGNQGSHAFAYDLRTGVMTDLGSLAGPSGVSSSVGISQGRYITGYSDIPGQPYPVRHAFLYDLRTHTMTDLGANGALSSQPTSISGHTIVGYTEPSLPTSGDTPHGFAYDIRTHTWTDLGAELNYRPIVTGHTVVSSNRGVAYTYDLSTGTLTPFRPGLGRTNFNNATGPFVLGDVYPDSFGYIYRPNTGQFTELPAPGGLPSTATNADPHGAVVGNGATPAGPYHATLWVPGHA
jgi:probable HAF family extracellular repeat protein